MNQVSTSLLACLDELVVREIMEKYGLDEKKAFDKFVFSQTYQMLCDYSTALYMMSPLGLLDMWECEQVTGDPRNSVYIRGE